ncbi:MAG: hypothetical protein LBS57_01585 [Treponema sp.]|jgi:hypothetical protein|nr:hypothetical protein [Treponema sp.]
MAKEEQPSGPVIHWHPAFFEAIQLELESYRDILEFKAEYQLSAEPLRIDVLIIKKLKDVVIEKNIGTIFRTDNILEFKSPGDHVSVEDFYKVYGYACLYVSLNRVSITDITLSFVESRRPRELLKHLEQVRGFRIEKPWPGIYTVKGDIIPVQIINSRELSAVENRWLRDLNDRLDIPEIRAITAEIQREGKYGRIWAYLEAIYNANLEKMEEAFKMSDTALTLDKVLENIGLTTIWEERGEERGEKRGKEKKALEIAQNLLKMGLTVEQIAEASALPVEKVQALQVKK